MSPEQCQAARALLGWRCEDIEIAAKQAGLSLGVATIWRFEAGGNVRASSTEAIRITLESAGVEFIPENGGGAGVRLKKQVSRTHGARGERDSDS